MTEHALDDVFAPKPDFEIEREIEVPLPALRSFLCDLHQYVPLHPFIESIEELPATAELPEARRYRVVDRIPMGPFQLKTVYTAALNPASETEVHGYAWQSPGIRLRTVYALSETLVGTRLVERCSIAAPFLFRRFVVSQARVAHTKTLSEMKELLEGKGALGV